jgi:hypothetical protein
MDELSEELDRFETGSAIRRGRQRAEDRIIERRLEEGRRQERGDEPRTVSRPDTRTVSRPETRTANPQRVDPNRGPTADTGDRFRGLDTDLSPRESQLAAQLGRETPEADLRDVFEVPQDPLDTSGGIAIGASRTASTVGTAAGVSGVLGQGAETATASDLDFGTAPDRDADGLGLGTGVGVGTGLDVTPGPDVGVGSDTGTDTDLTPGQDTNTDATPGQDTDQTPVEILQIDARTQLGSRGSGGNDPGNFGGSGGGFGQPDQGTPPGTPDTPGTPNTPRVPDIPDLPDEEIDEQTLRFEDDAEDAIFGSGIASGESLSERIFGDGNGR